jgi:hypothetical protein
MSKAISAAKIAGIRRYFLQNCELAEAFTSIQFAGIQVVNVN